MHLWFVVHQTFPPTLVPFSVDGMPKRLWNIRRGTSLVFALPLWPQRKSRKSCGRARQ